MSHDSRPLVMHVMHAFDVGGLENGVVNLINHLPVETYRHAILALTKVSSFRHRIKRDDVTFLALDKPPGHAVRMYPRVWKLMREMRPTIVHTRNLAALELAVPAAIAGVPVRVHGEHGWDMGDLDGSSNRYRWVRRVYRPVVTHWVALSQHSAQYLRDGVGVPSHRVTHVCNGVDTTRFCPVAQRARIPGCPFGGPDEFIVGTVGRMQPVKDPLNLVRAFIAAANAPEIGEHLRLIMIGDGPLRDAAQKELAANRLSGRAWLPGERHDIPELLRGLDCFVLPSLAEGISNTLLEAMASGLPIVATRVGGNPELVLDGVTGLLVPAADPQALGAAMLLYALDSDAARVAGAAGRQRALELYSIEIMVERYRRLYDELRMRATSAHMRAGASATTSTRAPAALRDN